MCVILYRKLSTLYTYYLIKHLLGCNVVAHTSHITHHIHIYNIQSDARRLIAHESIATNDFRLVPRVMYSSWPYIYSDLNRYLNTWFACANITDVTIYIYIYWCAFCVINDDFYLRLVYTSFIDIGVWNNFNIKKLLKQKKIKNIKNIIKKNICFRLCYRKDATIRPAIRQ